MSEIFLNAIWNMANVKHKEVISRENTHNIL